MTIRPSSGETWLKMSFQKATFSSLFWFYNDLLWMKAETKFDLIMEGYSKPASLIFLRFIKDNFHDRDVDYMENEKPEGFEDWFTARIIQNDRAPANIAKISHT